MRTKKTKHHVSLKWMAIESITVTGSGRDEYNIHDSFTFFHPTVILLQFKLHYADTCFTILVIFLGGFSGC